MSIALCEYNNCVQDGYACCRRCGHWYCTGHLQSTELCVMCQAKEARVSTKLYGTASEQEIWERLKRSYSYERKAISLMKWRPIGALFFLVGIGIAITLEVADDFWDTYSGLGYVLSGLFVISMLGGIIAFCVGFGLFDASPE